MENIQYSLFLTHIEYDDYHRGFEEHIPFQHRYHDNKELMDIFVSVLLENGVEQVDPVREGGHGTFRSGDPKIYDDGRRQIIIPDHLKGNEDGG